jgi:hypothetical protein
MIKYDMMLFSTSQQVTKSNLCTKGIKIHPWIKLSGTQTKSKRGKTNCYFLLQKCLYYGQQIPNPRDLHT